MYKYALNDSFYQLHYAAIDIINDAFQAESLTLSLSAIVSWFLVFGLLLMIEHQGISVPMLNPSK